MRTEQQAGKRGQYYYYAGTNLTKWSSFFNYELSEANFAWQQAWQALHSSGSNPGYSGVGWQNGIVCTWRTKVAEWKSLSQTWEIKCLLNITYESTPPTSIGHSRISFARAEDRRPQIMDGASGNSWTWSHEPSKKCSNFLFICFTEVFPRFLASWRHAKGVAVALCKARTDHLYELCILS